MRDRAYVAWQRARARRDEAMIAGDTDTFIIEIARASLAWRYYHRMCQGGRNAVTMVASCA